MKRALFLLPLAGEGAETKSRRMRALAACLSIIREAARSLIRPSLTRGPPSPACGRRGGGILAFALAALLATPALAGDIVITAPWLRATPKGASVAAGYATITNTGAAPDRLLGARLPMAAKGEVHSMSMTNGVMEMRRLDQGLAIAPGATVALTPGGYHLMFVKPTRVLKEGESIAGTLLFEKAGAVPVTFPVAGFGARAAPN